MNNGKQPNQLSRITSWLLVAALIGSLFFSVPASAASAGADLPLKQGDRGSSVVAVQRALNGVCNCNLKEDGIFGSSTRKALEWFQWANGMTVDGIVGSRTWSALGLGKRTSKPAPAPKAEPLATGHYSCPSSYRYVASVLVEVSNGAPRWRIEPTASARTNNGSGSGSGWNEVIQCIRDNNERVYQQVSKAQRESLYYQYKCHMEADGHNWPKVWDWKKGQFWNLESWRPNNTNYEYDKCNF